MPQFKTGEMFKSHGFIIVTANSFLTSDFRLVMGSGAAFDLKRKVPGIDRIFGRMIFDICGHLGIYGLLSYKRYGIFQVKVRFDEKARMDLIQHSLFKLSQAAKRNKEYRYNLNFPGIGYGRLERKEVIPLLDTLPENVVIWERPMTEINPKEVNYGVHPGTL